MTGQLHVVGIDPGPVPGIVDLRIVDGRIVEAEAVQCTHGAAELVIAALLSPGWSATTIIAVERYVVGARSGKLSNAQDSAITRDLVGAIRSRWPFVQLRSASQVKPWATEDRLAKARLLEPTKGMRHARDAGRHALFAAVHDGGLPDPLSRRWAS